MIYLWTSLSKFNYCEMSWKNGDKENRNQSAGCLLLDVRNEVITSKCFSIGEKKIPFF